MIPSTPSSIRSRFRAIVPRIKTHGKVYFRGVKCPDQKREFIAEMLALAWKWFVRLYQQGKDPMQFPSALASFAAKHVSNGRRLCGQGKVNDVFSPVAQRRYGFVVARLSDHSTLSGNPLADALKDNTQTSVPEQVAFRLDYPRWRKSQPRRDRRLLDRMMMGEETGSLATQFGLSPARISQKRREFCQDWHAFCGEAQP